MDSAADLLNHQNPLCTQLQRLSTHTAADQAKEPLGVGKFNPMWHGPYMVKHVLEKGAYELVDYVETSLVELRNGLYLKKYYA